MATADSNTNARSEIEPAVTTLLKTPLNTAMDLFQVLDYCQHHADVLIESDDRTERMALCGRLYAGLEVLKVVLKAPLPEYLIERLTLKAANPDDYHCPLSTDSETLREYCSALTMVLLQGPQPYEQEEKIAGLLSELLDVMVDDLKAPRFVRSASGLILLNEDSEPVVH